MWLNSDTGIKIIRVNKKGHTNIFSLLSGHGSFGGDVVSWFNEEPDYDYWTLACNRRPCGHYTQVQYNPDISRFMMTSSNGNIFRVTGHLCEEFNGYRLNPRTKASDAELWCFSWSAPEQMDNVKTWDGVMLWEEFIIIIFWNGFTTILRDIYTPILRDGFSSPWEFLTPVTMGKMDSRPWNDTIDYR